ncbi:MAG: hypothetical protein FWG07_03795 [Treponema sp.]|nr:hypothetical protein [Treponema sp.]
MDTESNSFSVDSKAIEIFSAEERNEINEHIEAASTRDAVTAPGIPSKEEALKRGLFPLFVNAAAVVLLTAGVLLLFTFQRTDAAEIRKSGAVLGVTERALIREIRKEINSQLNEKDQAIEAMIKRLAEIDSELNILNSLEVLTAEQQKTMEELLIRQEEYRENLTVLQHERTQILTQARIREAEIRQREEKLLEQQLILENISAQSRAEIENAREELLKLSSEAEKTTLIERQLAAFYTTILRQIEERQFSAAENSIAALNEYLATSAFSSIKTIQARYASDVAAVHALSLLLSEAQKSTDNSAVVVQVEALPPVPPGADAEAALRQQVSVQAESIAKQNTALAELQKTMDGLQQQNEVISQTIAERDRQLESLRSQNVSQAQQIESLQKTITNINSALRDNQQ